MSTLFAIFLISFFMSIFVVTIGLIIYHFAIVNNNYNYNPNIIWLNSVIQAGLPAQYNANPPPELPRS